MFKLEIGDKLHGFVVKNKRNVEDIDAVMYEMEHGKCGAKLIFLSRDDENKTFSVGFKTVPKNSTGVFHIIEHSVLCGSRSFQVKEPFVELLKSSLQTFLNAFTFPDKTLYPLSSRNDKDFMNLADVYLDAVFNPAILTNKSIFLQEGWRKEIDEDGKLSYNGVVFNEMKGAYSSPEEFGEAVLNEKLYGNACYGYDSGGSPEAIPTLSYEEFIETFKKFYHPSNAYFFLDGKVKIEETLALIESYIGAYEKLETSIEIEDAWAGEESYSETEYEISPEESEENKARLLAGFVSTRFDETLEKLALDVAFDAVSASNESPLQKEILKSGLCEKMSVAVGSSRLRNNVTVEFCNIKDGSAEELFALFKSTLADIVGRGINREHLEASLNRFEFNLRERDLGGLPVGIAFNIAVFDTWLYGGDPILSLEFENDFKKLRELMNGDYFENIIRKYVLENEKCAKVLLLPSSTLGSRREASEAEARLFEKESLTREDIESINSENEALLLWQNTDDSEAALASLPTLGIEDIPEKAKPTPVEILGDGKIVRHNMNMNGISYTELYFDASDTDKDELFLLPLLSAMFKNSATAELDSYSLQNLLKREFGSVTISPVVFAKNGEVRVFMKLTASILDSKKAVYSDILEKLIYETSLSDKNGLSNVIRQIKIMLESNFSSDGNAYGIKRAMAYRDAAYAVREGLSGYEFYKKIKEIEAELENKLDGIIEKIKRLREKIFKKERLTLSLAGAKDEEFEEKIFDFIKAGGALPPASSVAPLGEKNEGIAIPSRVGFAVSVSSLSCVDKDVEGAMIVAEMILNYEYLWSEVRVKGGAYGVSLKIGNDGRVVYSSYRDPSPDVSLAVFKSAPAFLREFIKSGKLSDKYIIGAMGEFEPYLSEPSKAAVSTFGYFSGYTEEKREKLRAQILRTDESSLLKVADVLESLAETFSSIIVAPKEKISAETILYV